MHVRMRCDYSAYRDLERTVSAGVCLLINGEARESFLIKFKFGQAFIRDGGLIGIIASNDQA